MQPSIFLTSIFLIQIANTCAAQCLSGNCENGSGKFDFGYAVYSGTFRKGEPNGTGTLDYGGGERYVGDFTDGKENGSGLMYRKDGSYEAVQYRDGKLLKKEKITIVGGNVIVDGCVTGNCIDSYSTLIFPSGNKYVGNFKDYQPEGNGKFIFASGDTAEGIFSKGVLLNGKFKYVTGETFKGTFNADGTPRTGKYSITAQGDAVEIKDNTVFNVRNVGEERLKKEAADKAAHDRLYKKCKACNGKGGEMGADSYKVSKKTYTGLIYDEYEITTHYGPPKFNTCLVCMGKGEVKR